SHSAIPPDAIRAAALYSGVGGGEAKARHRRRRAGAKPAMANGVKPAKTAWRFAGSWGSSAQPQDGLGDLPFRRRTAVRGACGEAHARSLPHRGTCGTTAPGTRPRYVARPMIRRGAGGGPIEPGGGPRYAEIPCRIGTTR